jgi:TonB family protein
VISNHDRIEALAGAIALGEATDDERAEYRAHISSCQTCLHSLGGEHELARVASTVASARESEMWEPNLGDVVQQKTQRRTRVVRFGFGFLGAALCVSFGLHALLASGIAHLTPALAQHPVVINAGATRIVLEQSAETPAPKPQPPQRHLIVTHNVVQMARAPIPATLPAPAPRAELKATPRQIADVTVHADPVLPKVKSNVPIWRRNDSTWRTVARTTTTSVSESAPQAMTHSAESIHIGATREATPIGGEAALNPQPPMIAYDEGAEGTVVFEVSIDERGNPTKCVITKSSHYPVLDNTVCKAALEAHYTPKTVGGRAVSGTYQDAFTFRSSQDEQRIEGIPKTIQPFIRP